MLAPTQIGRPESLESTRMRDPRWSSLGRVASSVLTGDVCSACAVGEWGCRHSGLVEGLAWALGRRAAPGDPPGHMLPEEEEVGAQRRPGAEEVRQQPGAQEGAIRERKTPQRVGAWKGNEPLGGAGVTGVRHGREVG